MRHRCAYRSPSPRLGEGDLMVWDDCTTTFLFLCAPRRFSSCLQQLVELMDAGSGRGKNSDDDGASSFGHVVAMGMRHFLRKFMGAQQPKFAAYGCRTASPLLSRCSLGVVQQRLQVSVSKAVNEELAVVDGS